jgi:hypothetical protein
LYEYVFKRTDRGELEEKGLGNRKKRVKKRKRAKGGKEKKERKGEEKE